jgi:hypothetical protein
MLFIVTALYTAFGIDLQSFEGSWVVKARWAKNILDDRVWAIPDSLLEVLLHIYSTRSEKNTLNVLIRAA